jgi:hypothetical protein
MFFCYKRVIDLNLSSIEGSAESSCKINALYIVHLYIMQVHSSGVSDLPISENRKIREFGEQETLPANQRGRETSQSRRHTRKQFSNH